MKIAVASPPYPKSVKDALYWIDTLAGNAAEAGALIVCFPETYIPGYPGAEFSPERCTDAQLRDAFESCCEIAKKHKVALIIPMDWYEGDDFLNVAQVISKSGEKLGYQAKVQLDPSEDKIWKAGNKRCIFEMEGLKFGISICHEGFRYPETVRWAATHGAQLVFHPNLTGSAEPGIQLKEWGHKDNPYYKKAQMLRAMENTIYYASSNYCFEYPESASAIIAPGGNCLAWQNNRETGVTVAEIDLAKATGLLAKRFRAELCDTGNINS